MQSMDRIKPDKYEFAYLIDEVDGMCPLCGKKLLNLQVSKNVALSQIAHIYPHSPTTDELPNLDGLPLLSENAECVDNLIALCPNCHYKFDHPRTRGKYMELFALKKRLIYQEKARTYYENHCLDNDIIDILEAIGMQDTNAHCPPLSYNVKTISDKMSGHASMSIINAVKRDVRDYYASIRRGLTELEHYSPGSSDLIASEVKTLYLELNKAELSQDVIYDSIIDWMNMRTQHKYEYATPIMTAYYIQNCEVFSDALPK